MTAPREQPINSNGQSLMVYDWTAATADAPAILLLHAAGFHGRCWDQIARQLPEYRRCAWDAPGHGRSYQPDDVLTWSRAGQDAAAVAQALGLSGAIGVGHSMGGNSLVRAAAAVPGAFAALLLIDPVIFPRDFYAMDSYTVEGHFVLQRRRQWASPDEMFARFRGRGSFATWEDAILRDYCDYGLVPDGGGYTLACTPEIEANVYCSAALASNGDIYDAVSQVDVPVRVLRCARGETYSPTDFLSSPTVPDLAHHFKHGVDVPLPNNTHFIPMESPQLVIQHIRELTTEIGKRSSD